MSPLLSRQGRCAHPPVGCFGRVRSAAGRGAPRRARGGPEPRHRPGVRPADGARAPPVPDRRPDRRAARPATRTAAGVYCTRAAGQRRLPHRRARAGQVVRRRHRAEGRQVRLRAARAARRGGRRAPLGAGQPPLHRFRIGLEFADLGPPGRRRHDRPARGHGARRSAEQLGLAERRARRRSARPTSSGTARAGPGTLRGEAVPIAVADRRSSPSSSRWPTAGRRRGGARARPPRSGQQFDPDARRTLCRTHADDDPRRARRRPAPGTR